MMYAKLIHGTVHFFNWKEDRGRMANIELKIGHALGCFTRDPVSVPEVNVLFGILDKPFTSEEIEKIKGVLSNFCVPYISDPTLSFDHPNDFKKINRQ